MPMKPMSVRAGKAFRGGSGLFLRRIKIANRKAVPRAKRVNSSVTGETSRRAIFPAMNEQPHMRIVRLRATRGGRLLLTRFNYLRTGMGASSLFGFIPRGKIDGARKKCT